MEIIVQEENSSTPVKQLLILASTKGRLCKNDQLLKEKSPPA